MTEIVDALKIIENSVKWHGRAQIIGLFDAVDKILAQDIICVRSLPPFDNSAMDGYGVKYADVGKKVKIVGTVFAGDALDIKIEDGEAIKIMTGAPTPLGIEVVVPFENAKMLEDGLVELPADFKIGANIRRKGEEIKEGDVLAKAGQKLTPALIGLLASQGIMAIKVSSKPKIGLISSGSEVIEPWESAKEHQIYNSNALAIWSYCVKFDCDVEYIKLIADNYEEVKEFFGKFQGYDLLITSGGISVGEADYIVKALEANGFNAFFKKVNIKPGKPTVFGFLGKTAVLALPGNPLAALVNFYLFGQTIVSKLKNQTSFYPQIVTVKNQKDIKLKNARASVIFGVIDNGEFLAYEDGKHSSAMLTPMVKNSAFVILSSDLALAGVGLNAIIFNVDASNACERLISNV